ncbi:MAG: hypothetical protein ACRD5B_15100 [Nitrososphaeraceae archaeon]
MEEGITTLEEKDIVIITTVAAMVHTNLKRIRMNYFNPKEFGEKGPTQLAHRDIFLAFSFLYNIHEVDTMASINPKT